MEELHAMANTKFGRTVLETIQVQLQTKDDPRPEIVRLLDELIKDTTTQKVNEEADYRKYVAFYNGEVKRLEAEIDADEAVVKSAEARLPEAEKELQTEEDKIAATKKLIESLEKDLADKTAIRKRQHANWEIIDARYAKLISILQRVEAIIAGRVSARKAGKGAFVEKVANTELVNALAELKEEITADQEDVDGHSEIVSFIATKAQNLMDLSPEEAVKEAGDALNFVIHICRKYQLKYAQEREDDAHIELERKLNFTAYRDEQLQTIAHENTVLAIAEKIAADRRDEITDLKVRISEANARLDQARDDLKVLHANYKARTEQNKTLVKQLTEELALLDKILDIVNKRLTHLRANVEQAIIHSSIKA
jgi:chromosome segregation ATPase